MERFAREQAPERAERTDTLVWGKNAVTELLKSGGAVDTVYLTDTMPQAVAGYYTALAKESGAVVKRVPGNKLQKMCGTPDHQGVAARAAEVEYAALDDLFRAAETRGEQPFLVLCDGVEDPHNLGAIVRSAYLCGAHGVVIPKRGGVGVTGTVMKASAGAAAHCPRVQPGPGYPHDQGAQYLRLLRGPRRCPAGKNGPLRPGGAGSGQ